MTCCGEFAKPLASPPPISYLHSEETNLSDWRSDLKRVDHTRDHLSDTRLLQLYESYALDSQRLAEQPNTYDLSVEYHDLVDAIEELLDRRTQQRLRESGPSSDPNCNRPNCDAMDPTRGA